MKKSPGLFFSTRRVVKNSPGLFEGRSPPCYFLGRQAGLGRWLFGQKYRFDGFFVLVELLHVGIDDALLTFGRSGFHSGVDDG